jgi:cystathionine beta-synthase
MRRHRLFHNNILEAIGNTPLVKLNKVVDDSCATVLVKCEFMNPTGSIKDRMALHIINDAEKRGLLKPGGMIVENTSGNTGLALAMVAAVKGYRCVFTMPDKMSAEKINMIKSFGAEVVVTPTDVAGDSPEHYVNTAKRIAKETKDSFYVDQYHCSANVDAHYHSTGAEILEQTEGKLDYFVAGTGTGGTISGVGRYMRENAPHVKMVGVDPIGSVHYDLFHTGKLVEPAIYKVEGIGEDIKCEALDLSVIDDMRQTNDKQAFLMARSLIREEGLFCGGSSGAIVHGAVELAKEIGPGKTIVTVLTDSASRYISKFLSDAWMKDHGFLSPISGLGVVRDMLQYRTQKLITTTETETLGSLIDRLKSNGISQLPILDTSGTPIAMVHEMDILHGLQSGKVNYDSKASTIAHPIRNIVTPNSALEDLYQIFDAAEVAVCVDKGELKGIISKIDMIDYMMEKLNGNSR